jgi:hypothetical protein
VSELFEKPRRSWREIADEASHESDPKRLIQLADELTRALDERDNRAHRARKQALQRGTQKAAQGN